MKPMTMVIVAVILGVGMGGTFLGGLIIGRGAPEASAAQIMSFPTPTTSGAGQQSGSSKVGEVDMDRLSALREKMRSGEELTESERNELREIGQRIRDGSLSAEQLSQLRERFGNRNSTSGASGGRGRPSRWIRGTIQSIEGNNITVETSQGPLKIKFVEEETSVRLFSIGTLKDLDSGMNVTVSGERGEDNSVQARGITVIPEGVGSGGRSGF